MMDVYPVSHISRLRMGSDGEGIRTLILFHGCSLRCKYCINSFTWDGSKKPKKMSVQNIYDSILIDRPYMLATNGGVTFGGGEPLLHSRAIKEFSDLNKDGFTIYIETALNVLRENLMETVKVTDMYYVDIKSLNPDIYQKYTGGSLWIALDNLKYLLDEVGSEKVVVRVPIIPGINNEIEQIRARKYLQTMGVKKFDLFSYKKVDSAN